MLVISLAQEQVWKELEIRRSAMWDMHFRHLAKIHRRCQPRQVMDQNRGRQRQTAMRATPTIATLSRRKILIRTAWSST